MLLTHTDDLIRSTCFVLGILERRNGRPEAAEANFIEAQNMWFKGDQNRLHPFNAGCIYKTGVVCLDQGKLEAAVYVLLLRSFFISPTSSDIRLDLVICLTSLYPSTLKSKHTH